MRSACNAMVVPRHTEGGDLSHRSRRRCTPHCGSWRGERTEPGVLQPPTSSKRAHSACAACATANPAQSRPFSAERQAPKPAKNNEPGPCDDIGHARFACGNDRCTAGPLETPEPTQRYAHDEVQGESRRHRREREGSTELPDGVGGAGYGSGTHGMQQAVGQGWRVQAGRFHKRWQGTAGRWPSFRPGPAGTARRLLRLLERRPVGRDPDSRRAVHARDQTHRCVQPRPGYRLGHHGLLEEAPERNVARRHPPRAPVLQGRHLRRPLRLRERQGQRSSGAGRISRRWRPTRLPRSPTAREPTGSSRSATRPAT